MTTRIRPLRAADASLAIALLTSACSTVLEYPEKAPERGAELCADGVDNDEDDESDCDDPDCDGFCSEESSTRCSDGRDNDGDDLVDAADPRCWLIVPPKAERCAEASGVEIFETFDGDNIGFADPSSPWQPWQTGGGYLEWSEHQSMLRGDPILSFIGLEANPTEQRPVQLVRQRPFAGSWRDFALSFSASVSAQGFLRVGVVPMSLAPSLSPPLPGAENALFAVTVDALQSQAILALSVDGIQVPAALPPDLASCGTEPCEELVDVEVAWDGDGFRATLERPNGRVFELQARAPASLSLPPSRLVIWGGSSPLEAPTLLDDLELRVKPEWPCGFRSPALDPASCEHADGMTALGHTVSVARAADGRYCAFVTGDANAGPRILTAWSSSDGERWSVATSVNSVPSEPPEGAEIVGAGVAADSHSYAALAFRDATNVRLFYSDGDGCDEWGPLERGPTLFPDAEPPSYVISGGHHDVYFTRPPGDERKGRTLWRVRRDRPEEPPEQLFELPSEVAAPISVQRVGTKDLVIAYPVLPGSGRPGVGLLVRADDDRAWSRVEPSPVLELPGTLDAFPGQKLGFDDDGAASAALVMSGERGILVYAGRSRFGLAAPSRLEPLRSELAVGIARLASATAFPTDDAIVPRLACGDGRCDEHEDSVRCEVDCPATGVELLGDALADEDGWQVQSSDPEPMLSRYLTADPPALNWASAETTWSVLPLEPTLVGDFELSFDLFVAHMTPTGEACSVYVGLGTPSTLALDPVGADLAPSSGVFVRTDIDSDCPSRFHLLPVALNEDAEDSQSPSPQSCLEEPTFRADAWRYVVLRRRGEVLGIQTAHDDGCGLVELERSVSDLPPAFSAVVVGFGGASFESCKRGIGEATALDDPLGLQANHGSIRNVMLRSLEARP